MVISCCWFNLVSVLWWHLVFLSLSVYCRWPGTARCGARQIVEVRIIHHVFTHSKYIETQFSWCWTLGSDAFSSCITLTSCFTGRGLERTMSFCLTSGSLPATFSIVVSRLIDILCFTRTDTCSVEFISFRHARDSLHNSFGKVLCAKQIKIIRYQ